MFLKYKRYIHFLILIFRELIFKEWKDSRYSVTEIQMMSENVYKNCNATFLFACAIYTFLLGVINDG